MKSIFKLDGERVGNEAITPAEMMGVAGSDNLGILNNKRSTMR